MQQNDRTLADISLGNSVLFSMWDNPQHVGRTNNSDFPFQGMPVHPPISNPKPTYTSLHRVYGALHGLGHADIGFRARAAGQRQLLAERPGLEREVVGGAMRPA